MDVTTLVLLIIVLIYFLFNIKNVYQWIFDSFAHNGTKFTLGLIVFSSIFIAGCFIGFFAPKYGWIPQYALILFIIGFFAYRFLIGFKD